MTQLEILITRLSGRRPRFQSVQATYRVWRREARLRQARHADITAARARGVSVTSSSPSAGDAQPAETEGLVREWRQRDGVRHEIHGGLRDGELSVAAGGLWWWWHPDRGTRRNAEDPRVRHPVRGLPFVFTRWRRYVTLTRAERATKPQAKVERVPRGASGGAEPLPDGASVAPDDHVDQLAGLEDRDRRRDRGTRPSISSSPSPSRSTIATWTSLPETRAGGRTPGNAHLLIIPRAR